MRMRKQKTVNSFIANALYSISRVRLHYVLLMILIPLGELHNFFHGTEPIDVFLFLDFKLWPQWIVKLSCQSIQFLIVSYLLYAQPKRTPVLNKIYLVIFLFAIIDLVLFFLNFKRGFYGTVYFCISGFFIYWQYVLSGGKKSAGKKLG